MTTTLDLNPTDWLVVEWTACEARLQNKETGAVMTFSIN